MSDWTFLKDCKLKYLDTEDTTAYVVIKNNHQTEYHENGKYFIKSTIKWFNEREYYMTMTEITLPDFPYSPGEKMKVKFDKIEKDTIYCTTIVRGNIYKGSFKILASSSQ